VLVVLADPCANRCGRACFLPSPIEPDETVVAADITLSERDCLEIDRILADAAPVLDHRRKGCEDMERTDWTRDSTRARARFIMPSAISHHRFRSRYGERKRS